MSIFKSTLKPYIRRQINARQNLLSLENRPAYFNRWVSSKSPWVKMSSFVDVNGTDSLARNYVLYGGTAYSGPELGDNQLALRSGINVRRGAYGDLGDRTYGVRPMPGITNVEIKSKSAYGSLREAIVTFYAWDKKQLEDLEKLYMRVGYYVLLEYGWSMYLDTNAGINERTEDFRTRYPANNSKDAVDVTKNIIRNFDDVTIDPFSNTLTDAELYNLLESYRFKYSGNYDGMLGVVRNFNWEFLPNGGYVCSTTIISIGDVIDSIKMSSVTTQETTNTGNDGNPNPTTFELILDSLNAEFDNPTKNDYKKAIDDLNIPQIHSDIVRINKNVNTGDETRSGYIQFAYLIFILRNQINLFDDKGSPLLDIEIPIYNLDGYSNGLCVASVDSVSVDISKCFINNSKATFVTGRKEGFILPTDYPCKEYLHEDTTLGVIGNIYFNLKFVKSKYQEFLKKGSVYVGEFIRSLVNEANICLGNINAFELFVIDNVVSIIDKQYTEVPADTIPENKFLMNLSGNNTAILRSKIQSTIFPSQATIMAIAAQDRENVGAINSSTQVAFNKGLSNRLKKINVEFSDKKVGYDNNEEVRNNQILAEKQKIVQNVISLRTYIRSMLENNLSYDNNVIVSSMSSVLNSILLKINTDANYKAVIPINLEITLDGIGGFTIGEIFRVNQDILPTDYNSKNLGFIITGISNTINRARWETTLSTQICLLDQNKLIGEAVNINKEEANTGIFRVFVKNISKNEDSVLIHNLLAAFCKDYFDGFVDSNVNIFNTPSPTGFVVGIRGKYDITKNPATFQQASIIYNDRIQHQLIKTVRGYSSNTLISFDTANKRKNVMLEDLSVTFAKYISTDEYQSRYLKDKADVFYNLYFPKTLYENNQIFIQSAKSTRTLSIELLQKSIYDSITYKSMTSDVKAHFDVQFNRMIKDLSAGNSSTFTLLKAQNINSYDEITGESFKIEELSKPLFIKGDPSLKESVDSIRAVNSELRGIR